MRRRRRNAKVVVRMNEEKQKRNPFPLSNFGSGCASNNNENGEDDDDEFGMDPEEARFLRRLDAGLFSLQVGAGGSRAVCPCYQPCLLCVVCARVWWSWRVVPTRISVRRTPWQACSLQPARFGWLCRPHAKHDALSRSDLCCLWWSQLRYHVGMKLREQGGSLVDLYTSLTGITLSPY